MNGFVKAAGSLFAGVLVFGVTVVAVTEALAPYVWPSVMLGLPVGLVAGIATTLLAALGFTAREERVNTGQASERTRRRIQVAIAALVGFVVGGGLALVALSTQAVGFATAILVGGFPVGVVSAAVAAYLVLRRDRRDRPPRGSTTD